MTPTHKPEDGDRAPISSGGAESALPPYIYGHEAGPMERVWTQRSVGQLIVESERLLAEKAQRIERLEAALRCLVAMLPSDHEDRPEDERIPSSFCYVRWREIREARAALSQPHPHGG
jgi:hypothetical protein